MHTFFLSNRLSRWLALVLVALLSNSAARAQSTANYAFTTSSSGSLVDMSSGTTDALTTGVYRDDDASAVQAIGFAFVFMGTPYTQFSVNSNGQLRLGASAISGTSAAPTSGQAILGAFSGDNAMQATGKVSYKVVPGTNRTLVVQWTGLRIPYASDPAAGTPTQVQVVLEENTGKIEYRYGTAYNNGTSITRSIFISSGTSAGQIGVVKTFNTTPTYDATVTSATATTLADNAVIPVLNSTADGTRTVFAFTPTASPAAPAATISAVTQTSLTVTVTDNSTNEYSFSLYRSTDNVTFNYISTVTSTTSAATGGTVTFAQTGLSSSTTYYYRATANSEGQQTYSAAVSATTLLAVPVCGTKTVGPGADYASLTAAFAAVGNNGQCGPLVLELQANYVSTVETFPITYTGGSSTNTVTVRPAAGATGLSITGASASSILNLSGSKYFVLDGRPGGSGSPVSGPAATTDLLIANTNTSGITLNLASDATNNVVQHCQLKGVGTSTSAPIINFSGTATAGNSNNAVQNNALSSGATSAAVFVYSGSSSNASNAVTNNTLADFYSGTVTAYGIYLSSAGNGWTISGNSFYQTASRTPVAFTNYAVNILSGGGHTVSGNAIGGSAPATFPGSGPATLSGTWTASATAAAYRFIGINVSGSTTASTVTNNTIGNMAWYSSSGATTTPGVWCGIYLLSNSTAQGNTVGNNVTVTTTTSGGISYGIATSTGPTTVAVNGNTVAGLTAAGSAATIAGSVAGIQTAGTTNNVFQNRIYGLAAANAGASTGIIAFAGTTTTIYNNLIGSLTAPASTSLLAVAGLNVTGGTTVNAYYNSIYLNASSTGATFGTSGIYLNSTTTTLDARNNIVVNKSTAAGTGGYTAALRRVSGTAGTVPANLATTTNNNLYYAGTPSATNLIYVEGTTTATNAQQTLTGYKTFVATRESNSVTEDVPFLSTTGPDATFLHINPALATQVEGGGTPISGITTDFDGDARSATTPDLGADEGTFTPRDLSGPTIVLTALANTPSTANRTITVTISDPSGVDVTAANGPRLYYRKGTSGAFVFVSPTSVSGSSFTFTFDYSLIGGVTGFDVVQYYVAAQDVPGNASTNPTGGTSASPPGTTPPPLVYQYLIQGTLAGTYYVGTSTSPNPARTYPTLTAAANAYNQNQLGGAVTFVLLDATYGPAETFPIQILNNPDASATNTLTIKPNTGLSTSLTGSNASALLQLIGTDYVTLDGSNGGTISATDLRPSRNWTISNTNATTTSNVIVLTVFTSGTDAATNNTFKNLVVTGSGAAATQAGIIMLSTTAATGANNNNKVLNNALSGSVYGIYSSGASATLKNTGTVISQNDMTVTGAGAIGRFGITAFFEDGIQLTQNTVDGINFSGTGDVWGISAGFSGISTSTFTGNEVTNATINRNYVGVVKQTGTYSAVGIGLAAAASGTSVISNNMVAGVSSNGTGGDFGAGIMIGGGTGSTTRLLYNSVSMTGTQTGGSYPSFAMAIGGTTPTVEIRNNILLNTQSTGNNSVALGFAYSSTTGAYAGLTSGYNDFFVGTGSTFAVGQTGSLGTSGVLRTTLAALNTETGQDNPATSKNVNPQFVSAIDLHVTANALNNAGTPVSGVTDDFDGETRSATTPDIGADEFTPAVIDIAATALLNPLTTGCYGASETVAVSITNNSTTAINFATNPSTVTVTVTRPDNTTQTFTTTLSAGTLAGSAVQTVTLPGTLNMTAAGTYSFAIATATTGDGTPGNDNLTATRTVVGVVAQPQLVTFTGFTGSNLSTVFPGWSEATGATLPTGTSSAWTNQTGVGATGNTTAKVNLFSTGKAEWIVSPKFLATNSTVLTFDAGLTDYNSTSADPAGMTGTDDFVEVRISTDCGQTFARIPTFAQFNANNQPTNGSLRNYSIDLSPYAGQQIILGFFASEGTADDAPDYDFHLDNLSVRSPLPIDLGPQALLTPTATQGCYSAAETVSVSVTNLGSQQLDFAANPATITAVVTTPGGPQTLTGSITTGTLGAGANQTVTLTPTLDMTAVGTYSFAITATVTGDQTTSNDVLPAVTRTVAPPVAGTLAPASTSICVSGTASLTLTGAANGSIQYQTSPDNVTFTDVAGATSATFTTPVLTGTTYYRAQVRCGTAVATSNVSTITVNNPLVASTNTPVAICAGSTATLTATASTGASVRFFDVATGGTALATTTPGSYTTPALTANTTYYAEAYTGGTASVGPLTNAFGTGSTSTVTNYLQFNVSQPTTLLGVNVYPAAAGNVVIDYRSSTGTLIQTATVAVTAAQVNTKTFIPLNFSLVAGNTQRLVIGTGSVALFRNDSGASYPYTAGNVSITGNSFDPTYYYYYYDWSISSECAGATRTAIQVNVTQPATASFATTTGSTCGTSAFQLTGTVGGSATGGTYTSSGTGTFSPNATTLGATYTPSAADVAAGSVTITLTTTASTPCPAATATLALNISPAPVSTFSYPASTTYCAGSSSTVSPTLGSGATAGTFSSTTGLSIDPVSGVISLSTSTAGTYTVTNTVAASGACAAVSATTQVTITPATTATFSYGGGTFCVTGANPTATVTGTPGGTFSAAAGLSLNASTGAINLNASTPGTYTVTYTVAGACGSSSTQQVTITTAPLATFSYGTTPTYCVSGTTNPAPSFGTGASGGVFSSTSGLSINATTGVITLASSTPGTYTVTNTIAANGGCAAATATATVTITAAPVASFSYGTSSTFCVSGTTAPTVVLGTGATAGTFSSTTGLSINATTGAITLASSTPGTYTVTNSVAAANGCAATTATTQVTITAAPLATFSYPVTIYCAGGNTITPTPVLAPGATAGTFTSTTGLVINATTGVVNASTSTAGTYTVTNTVAAANGCAAATATATITISPRPATPTLTATYNGTTTTLTSSPAGGTIPGTYQFYLNGVLIPGATNQTYVVNGTPAQLGSYTVTVTNANGCVSLPSLPLVVTGAKTGLAGASLKLYPNPTPSGQVTLELTGYRSATQLTVLDALGRVVTQQLLPANAGTATHTLDLTGAATGVYLLRLSNADGVETRRLVRE